MALTGEYGFNEGSGTTAADSSGNNRNLTAANSTTSWNASGHAGAAGMVNFTGVVGANSSIASYTVMAWVLMPTFGTWLSVLSSGNLFLEISNTGVPDFQCGSGPNPNATANGAMSANTWTHIAGVCSAGAVSIYVNGTLQTDTGTSGASFNFGSGTWSACGDGSQDGTANSRIDDLRVFNTALTAGEITTYMNTSVGFTDPGPVPRRPMLPPFQTPFLGLFAPPLQLQGSRVAHQGVIPEAVTVTVGDGSVVLTQPTQDITPGAVTVTASAGSLSIAQGLIPEPVTVTATAGTLVITTTAAITPAAVTVTATGTLVVTQPTQDITPGAVTVTATAGSVTITQPTQDITPESVTVTASGSVSVSAPGQVDAYQATPQIPGMFLWPDLAAIQLQGARYSVFPEQTITPAAVTVTATDGSLSVELGPQAVTPAAVTVTATAGTLVITTTAAITPAAVTVTASGTLVVTQIPTSGLAVWFHAESLSGLADAAAVTSWTASTGTSVASQATSANQPTKRTVSGATVVRFDGSNDVLTANGDALTALQNVAGASIFIKAKMNNTNASVLFGVGGGVTAGNHRAVMRVTAGNWNLGGRRLDADSLQSVGTVAATTTRSVLSGLLDYANSDIFLYVNGGAAGSSTSFQTAGSTSNTASQATALGAGADTTLPASVDIYDIIIYNRVLDTTERQQVETYLGAPPAQAITPAAVTVTAAAGSVTVVHGIPVFPAAVTVTAAPGSLTITTGPVAITPAAVTVTASAGVLTVALIFAGIKGTSSAATTSSATGNVHPSSGVVTGTVLGQQSDGIIGSIG